MNKVKKRLDALTSQILANPALGKDDAIISELRGLRELLQTWRAFYAVQGQYSQFNSAQTIISNLHYNDAVQSYQKDVGGFPASVLGAIAGVKEVEPFA